MRTFVELPGVVESAPYQSRWGRAVDVVFDALPSGQPRAVGLVMTSPDHVYRKRRYLYANIFGWFDPADDATTRAKGFMQVGEVRVCLEEFRAPMQGLVLGIEFLLKDPSIPEFSARLNEYWRVSNAHLRSSGRT